MKTKLTKIVIGLICCLLAFWPVIPIILHSWLYALLFIFSLPMGGIVTLAVIEVFDDNIPEMEEEITNELDRQG
jgi:hypothetical protein